jgi:L-ascorbate metabolism protein UlaG (beta-lactamase superfamily)
VEIGRKTGAILVAPYGLQFNMKSVHGYPEKQATLATGGNVGGTFKLDKAGARVTMTNAVHGSEFTPPMVKAEAGQPSTISAGNPVGYLIQVDNGPTIYHTGDTDVYVRALDGSQGYVAAWFIELGPVSPPHQPEPPAPPTPEPIPPTPEPTHPPRPIHLFSASSPRLEMDWRMSRSKLRLPVS